MARSRKRNDPGQCFSAAPPARAADDAAWQQGAKFGQAGATLLEFSVAATVLAVLAVTFLGRLLYAEEYAEKTAMEVSIANMRAGLRAQVGTLLVADRAAEIAGLAGGNPTDWLEVPPENYVGEYRGRPVQDSRGDWYFDATRRELVYTANSQRHFVASPDDGYTVRLKIVPIANRASASSPREPGWVELVVVNDYRWF